MRHMMLRNTQTFGDLMREIIQPLKYGQGGYGPHLIPYEGDVGTKDNPSIVTRGEWVERQYKAWHEDDGSYHEQLIVADDLSELPNKQEGTD